MLDREMKKGSAELLILSLVESRARHGYEIGKLIEARSKGVLKFKVGSLYPLLYRRPLGGKARRETAALLQADEGRQASAQGATQSLAIIRGGDQSSYGIGKCLIGKPKFASAC
jgi:hypothetical protein